MPEAAKEIKTEDVKKETLEQLEDNKEQELNNESNEIETKAKEMGWTPKEEFQGDEETFVEAKEYVERAPLYKALHKANREIKKMKDTLNTFKEHYTKVEMTAKQAAIKELQEQLTTASEERDIGKALEIKDKITELSTETKAIENVQTSEYDTWVADNQWYEKDKQLHLAATGIGFGLQQEHPDWSVTKVYEEVTKMIKETFPDKFSNPNRAKPNKVGSGSKTVNDGTGGKKGVPTYSQLPEEARVNYKKLVKSGMLTHDEFFKDYLAVGGTLIEN